MRRKNAFAEYDPSRLKPYRVSDVAELLGIGKSTIYDACEREQIPHTRIGGLLLIPAYFVHNAMIGTRKIESQSG